jgi:sugar lactone lactonase YvrE
MAIDKNGNIYCVTVKNSDWSNRFIRKYSMNGAFEDLTNIPASSDPTIVIDSEQNLLVNANGITKKYNLSGQVVSSSSNFSTNYGVLLAAGANSGLFSIALDRYGSILNKIDGSTTVNLISAGAVGSTNNGRNSSFNFPQGMYLSKDGDLYIADTGNNVIRKVSLTTTPTDPTPTPTPTPLQSRSPSQQLPPSHSSTLWEIGSISTSI